MKLKFILQKSFPYFCCTALVMAVQFFLYLTNSPQNENMDFLGYVFYIGAAISHATLFATIPYVIYVISAIICKKDVIPNIIHIALTSFFEILIFINSYVFSLYRFHINGLIISMFFGEGSDEIFQFNTELYLKVGLISFALVIGNILLQLFCKKIICKVNKMFFLTSLIIFIVTLFSSNFIHAYSAVAQKQSVIKSAPHLPYYFPVTATRLMMNLGIVSPDDLLRADFGKQTDFSYPKSPIISHKNGSKNIILIAIDSWNYRTFNDTILPNITNFSRKCERFSNHLSSSNGTRGSIFGMFFGISSYYWKDFDITGTTPVLIDELNRQNYVIRTFPSSTLHNPNFAKLIFHKTPGITTETEGERVYDRDCQITKNFLDFIDSSNTKPFFAFLFYDLAHCFSLPEELPRKFSPSWDFADYMQLNNDFEPTPYWNMYCNQINAVDSLIGIVLSKIEEKNLLENSVIILTGDHGQEFNENHKNYWGHGSNYTLPQIHIPFIVHTPNCESKDFKHRTTHYDFSTTILQNVLNVENPISDYSMGKNIYDTTSRDWHIVGDNLNYAFIINDNKIVEKKPSGMLEIYDDKLNPIPNYKPTAKEIENSINKINMFYNN